MSREAEEREKRLSGDLEQLRSQQEQTFGSLDTRTDAMLERRTQAVMDRLDGLLGNKSGSRKRGAYSREASREPRVNANEHPNRGWTYGSTRERVNSFSNATGNSRPREALLAADQRISEDALLAADYSRMNYHCKTQIRLRE